MQLQLPFRNNALAVILENGLRKEGVWKQNTSQEDAWLQGPSMEVA